MSLYRGLSYWSWFHHHFSMCAELSHWYFSGLCCVSGSWKYGVEICFCRCVSIFAPAMFHHLGIDWAASVIGFVSVALVPIPFVFFVYGKRVRAMGKWSRASCEWTRNLDLESEVVFYRALRVYIILFRWSWELAFLGWDIRRISCWSGRAWRSLQEGIEFWKSY